MAEIVNGNVEGHTKFPEIILDTTLAELLAEEADGKLNESLCNVKPCADPRHKTMPVNKKYLITSSRLDDEDDLAHLSVENVNFLLSFWAGHMEVAFMACEGSSKDETLTAEVIEQNARRAFAVLNEKQRPWPRVFSNKDPFIKHYADSYANTRKLVRWGFAVDFAEDMHNYIHPEHHYRLNTKHWLSECPLNSANDRIIDPQCSCPTHTTKGGLWYFGHDCNTCKAAVETELSRLKDLLQNTEPPWVLKLTQSLGSVGTRLVKNANDRTQTIAHILKVQTDNLPLITAENAHIRPTSLVLSDFLPGKTNALNFYVRRDGSVKFLAACHQLSTRTTEGGRQHTAVTWDEQEKLEAKFRATLADIGKVLHDEGYFGPAGADIMEEETGKQYVIDLNVRTQTSTVLGCLRGHCKTRGFNACGVYECLLLSLSRDGLERDFEAEFVQGRLILMGGTRFGRKDVWAYPVVLAGEDQEAIKALGSRLLRFEAVGKKDENTRDAGGA